MSSAGIFLRLIDWHTSTYRTLCSFIYSQFFVRSARMSVRALRTFIRSVRICVRTVRTEIYSGREHVYCMLYVILFYESKTFFLWIQYIRPWSLSTQIAWFGIHLICKHALQILLWEAVKSAISINRHCRYKRVISSAYSSVLCLKMPVWVNVLLPSFLHIYFF